MRLSRALLPVAALLAMPLMLAASDAPAPLSAEAQKALAGRTAGKPLSCLQLSRVQSTRIVDSTAVIYKHSPRLWYVTQPDSGRCPLLKPDRVLITRTTGGALCESDMVTIAATDAPITYGACGVGPFVPYTK